MNLYSEPMTEDERKKAVEHIINVTMVLTDNGIRRMVASSAMILVSDNQDWPDKKGKSPVPTSTKQTEV